MVRRSSCQVQVKMSVGFNGNPEAIFAAANYRQSKSQTNFALIGFDKLNREDEAKFIESEYERYRKLLLKEPTNGYFQKKFAYYCVKRNLK